VSVIGLAVGFACFAMATLWIRYEMTYDSFHKNADRIYCVTWHKGRSSVYSLAGYLKGTFPEISHAIPIIIDQNAPLTVDDVKHEVDVLQIDSSFFGMFDVKIVAGSMNFLIPESKNIAITADKAKQLFGDEDPLGKTIKLYEEHTICAIVTGLSKHSNYPFDFLQPMKIIRNLYMTYGEHTLIELYPGVDVKAFKEKLVAHEIKEGMITDNLDIIPLTNVRNEDPNIKKNMTFQHLVIFLIVGSLLILCTLFNYLMLFISRFRIRQRELALRVVFGASNSSLFRLLSVEFFVSLFIALMLGLYIIYLAIDPLRELSGIRLELSSIGVESLVYISGIIVISMLAFVVTLAIFRRRTLNTSIRRSNNKLFRRVSIVFQLIISIGFAFCSIIILKQMYHLHNTDLGFAIKNCGSVFIRDMKFDISVFDNKIQQIPEITETAKNCWSLLPLRGALGLRIHEWEDKPETANPISIGLVNVSDAFLSYYEIEAIEGELLNDNDSDKDVLINESAAKAFGWHNAVGKTFNDYEGHTCTVKGVIKNIYNMSPTISAEPIFYCLYNPDMPVRLTTSPSIKFKFNEGSWQTCRKKIEEILKIEYPNMRYTIHSSEKEFDNFLKSENTLLWILSLVSLVCVIVCVFGFVSIVALTCEERRKEIAIRKINGATIKDILDLFFKEYLTLLIIGAMIAFPVGYLIMRRWLENYVMQTEINAWVYISILLALFMAIVLCIGGKVYRTSRENPANAIQKL
jgi:hypothetical protein